MPALDNPEPAAELIPAPIMSAATRHKPRQQAAGLKCLDGTWQPCQITAWARCQAGWAAHVRFPNGRQEWYLCPASPAARPAGKPRASG